MLRFRPALLGLEDRLAPAALTVNGGLDNTTSDSLLTLREAILLVNNSGNATTALGRSLTTGEQSQITGTYGSSDTVQFSSGLNGQTITLTGGQLSVSMNLTVSGPGASLLTVSGNNASRGFNVSASATVSIAGLTIANGRDSTNAGGGAIRNLGTLSLSNCTLSNNSSALSGGAIYNGGTMTVSGCTLANNTSSGHGGGITNAGPATIANSTFFGNTVTNASNGRGGAILQDSLGGPITITSSTIAGNSSAVYGGGIANTAGAFGVKVKNTVVANNSATSGPDVGWSSITSEGYNLIGNTGGTGTAWAATDKLNVNALLGSLANNGGPTQTVALLAGSPAIGNGDPAVAGSTDQRGHTRGSPTSIGAFQWATPSVTALANQAATPGIAQAYNLGSFSDADGGPWNVTVDWGDPAAANWSVAASMATPRSSRTTSLLLANGKVLVAGGYNGAFLSSAELYDPATNAWSAAAPMAAARLNATATLLGNGKVLVTGGENGPSLTSAELYDPATNTWSAAAPMGAARRSHTATLLSNGKVLVTGGGNGGVSLSSAELYDPATNAWSAAAPMATGRLNPKATLLSNGKVLVHGGQATSGIHLSSAELYDPATNSWSAGGAMTTTRIHSTTTLLAGGKVLVTGGQATDGSYLSSAELYDPATNAWSAAATLATSRYLHAATLLSNGKVLVAGGSNGSFVTSAELYDPATNAWSAAGSIATGRTNISATLLRSGKVLVAGGTGTSGYLSSAELYDSGVTSFTVSSAGSLGAQAHTYAQAGNYTVTVTVRDSDSPSAAAGSTSFEVAASHVYSVSLDGGGALTIGQATFANDNLTVSLAGGNYVITDVGGSKFNPPTGTRAGFVSGGGTNSITIPASQVTSIAMVLGSGTDFVTFTGSNGANLAPTSVNTGPNAGDQVTVNGAILAGGALSVTANGGTFTQATGAAIGLGNNSLTVNAASANFNANVTATGGGAIGVTTTAGISVNGSSTTLSTASGNLTLSANQQATSTAGSFTGINVNGSTVQSSAGSVLLQGKGGTSGPSYGVQVTGAVKATGGGGTVTVQGTGGNTTTASYGVYVFGNGSVTSAGTGAVSIQGTGGSGQNSFGVYVQGTGSNLVSSSGGNVSVTGQGGAGSFGNAFGAFVSMTTVTAGGAGTVTIQGTGGAVPTANSNVGVYLDRATVTSAGGNVSVAGQGGAGVNYCYGVYVSQPVASGTSVVTAGGGGTVTVQGTGGGSDSGNVGVFIAGNGAKVTSAGGAVNVTGQAGGTGASFADYGIAVGGGGAVVGVGAAPVTLTGTAPNDRAAISVDSDGVSRITSGSGDLTLTADAIELGSTSTISTTASGRLVIQPLTSGRPIVLGGNPVSGSLTLTTSGRAAIQDGFSLITIGKPGFGSGSVTTGGNLTPFTSDLVVQTPANTTGGITLSHTLDATGRTLNLISGSTINKTGAGLLRAATSTLTAPSGIGSSANPFNVTVSTLTTNTMAGNGNQFLQTGGSLITALNAGTGTITLTGGTFNVNTSPGIDSRSTVQVNAGTLGLSATTNTVAQLIINGGTVTGTTGVLTSTAVIDGRSGSVSARLAGTNGLTKTTAGTLTLTGNNPFTGTTAVSGGTLRVDGSLSGTTGVTVASGGTLGGVGTINGAAAITVAGGGHLAPGDSPGILTVGPPSLASGASFDVEIGSNAGSGYDQVIVNGTVSLGGATLNLSSFGGYIPLGGDAYTIIKNNGVNPVGGTFNGLAEGAVFSNFLGSGRSATITYQGGSNARDVVITVRKPTTTSITDPPITYGASASVTVTVTSTSTPTGSVSLTVDGGSPIVQALAGGSSTFTVPNLTAGTHSLSATFTAQGHFEASSATRSLTVNPKALTITANSTSKTYGQAVAFAGTEFTTGAGQLINGDTVTGVALTSAGAAASAGVGSHAIVAGSATGTGLGNYTISYVNGSLTVNAKALSITANDRTKTYGDSVTFAGTEFTTSGLVNSDTVTSVTLTSSGAAATANVSGSPYAIVASSALGTGLGNYTISYANGALTVNQRSITVTGDSKAKTYGNADPALTYQVTGGSLANGDSFNGALTRIAGESVGSYAIQQGTLALSNNYNLTYAGADFAITARSVTVAADGKTKTYGDADPTLAYQLTSGTLAFGDAFTGALTRDAGESVAGGPYTIRQGTLALSDNYSLTYVGANLAITARSLTLTANDRTKTYGDAATFAGTEFSPTGLAFSDAVTGVTLTSSGAAATAGVAGSPYAIVASGAVGTGLSNYSISYVNGALTVDAKALSITADSRAKTYGDAASFTGTEFTSGGLVNGDSVTSVTLTSAGAAATAGVGSYAIVAGAAVGSGLSNYTISYVNGSLLVSAKALTITANDRSKTYGDTVMFAGTEFTSAGLVNGDAVTGVTLTSTGAAATASASGSPYAIVASSALGTGLGNYTISYTNGNLTVNQRSITVSADAQAKTYGDADPALTYQITSGSLANGDGFDGALARVAGESVGGYAIQQGTLALNSNYSLTYAGADFAITARSVTVTADARAKTYGDADPALTYQITGGSLAFSDAFTGALTRDAGESVAGGPYAIRQGTLALSSNYALSYVGASLAVTPRSVTVTADAKAKTYGDADPGLTYQITSGSLALSDAFAGALTRAAGESVGSYAIQQGTLALSDNYSLAYVGADLDITARSLTLTANNRTKTYGDTVTFAGTEFTTSGLVSGDIVTGVTLTSAGAAATATVAGSPYAIVASGAAGTGLGNYTISYVGGALTVTPKALTVTANDRTKTFGDVVTFSGTEFFATGLVNDDVVATVALTSTGAAASANVGTYAIVAGGAVGSGLANYTIAYVGGSLMVDRRAVTVAADAQAKTYGDADPALTYQITIGSLANGDGFGGALTRVAGESVGGYAIQQGTLALNSNYSLTYTGAAFAITARAVTVTANAQAKTYGDADPTFTYQITSGSLALSDAFTGALTRAAGESVGSYAIQQGTLALNGNYSLAFVGADLAITAQSLTVTANDRTKTYGDAVTFAGTEFTASGLVNGDTITGVTLTSAGAALTAGVGSYAIVAGAAVGTGLANYTISYVNGALTVTARAVTVTADAATRTYGEADPALTYQITSGSLVNGDGFSGALARAAGENVGSYAIAQGTLALSANYNLTYAGAAFAITARSVTVTANVQTKTYGDADPTFTYQITSGSLAFADAFTGALTRDAGESVASGPYAIRQGTLALSDNYDLTFHGADLTITRRALTVTAAGSNKVYDGTTAATVTLSDSRLAGDDLTVGYATATFNGRNVGTAKPITVSGIAIGGADAGNYTVNATAASAADITPRLLDVTAADRTKAYGQAVTFAGTEFTTGAGQLVAGDAVVGLTLTSGGAAATAPVAGSPYAITATAAVGTGLSNYDIRYHAGTLTVARAHLTVAADDKAKVFGQAVPALTYTVTGFVNNEALATSGLTGTPALGTVATAASAVGTYAIAVGLGSLTAGNYDFTAFVSGTLIISQAQTGTGLSASNPAPVYGVDGVTLTATVAVVAPGAGSPTGTVTFYDGATALGSVAVSADGSATLVVGPTALAAGPHTLTAVHSGDGNFAGSQGSVPVTVQSPTGTASIQGLVWVDFNNDGLVDFGERAVVGVTVTLTGTDNLGNAVHRVVQTDAEGVYVFTDLPASSAAGYTITETQPAGLLDGRDALGTVGGVAVGSAAVNDRFSGVVLGGTAHGENYNFGERPATTGGVTAGQTAGIGFWQNNNGQNLIKALNGGPFATQLGHWLATTFPNMYAALDGLTNAQVAAFYKTLFARNGHSSPGGPPKTDAQVMATALAVYVTNQTLAGTTAAAYGFQVTATGVGTRTFNVGGRGAAFGVANNATVSVLDLLLAVNARSHNGLLYDLNGDGQVNSQEASYRMMVNDVFSAINEAGGI